jgi:hypothetical protein
MSTSTSTVKDIGSLGHVASNPQVTDAETYDMSPRTRKVVYLSLLAGVLFLGSVAAYVWYGFYQWRIIR